MIFNCKVMIVPSWKIYSLKHTNYCYMCLILNDIENKNIFFVYTNFKT